MTIVDFGDVLGDRPVMAILRGHGPDRTLEIARTAWSLGITCVEVPLQSDRDAASLEALAAEAADTNCVVGAGTILDSETVALARDLGAEFTVSPGLDVDVVAASLAAGMPHLPGVGSATDVHNARRLGLRWVKAFPASDLGSGWIRALLGPFPDMRFVATGGIHSANASKFLEAGAAAVAVGAALEDPSQLQDLSMLLASADMRG